MKQTDVSFILSDVTNDIYILTNKTKNEIVGFIIINNEYCPVGECHKCETKCSYIILLCIKDVYRKTGIFVEFLNRIYSHLTTLGINCVRLSAAHPKNLILYNSLGFAVENSDIDCKYELQKMI